MKSSLVKYMDSANKSILLRGIKDEMRLKADEILLTLSYTWMLTFFRCEQHAISMPPPQPDMLDAWRTSQRRNSSPTEPTPPRYPRQFLGQVDRARTALALDEASSIGVSQAVAEGVVQAAAVSGLANDARIPEDKVARVATHLMRIVLTAIVHPGVLVFLSIFLEVRAPIRRVLAIALVAGGGAGAAGRGAAFAIRLQPSGVRSNALAAGAALKATKNGRGPQETAKLHAIAPCCAPA
eukprot:CAMPEP_0181479536 /NCGR_PEP_ID=MMETSP1110-20121109/43333_1 /TAXON_ID=174948 /ORGANISM="Symbiodinium sp., Strain CCMP421" /LENGTH=238 /DNA_ID=CAMNT_0023604973 /DNA_START=381 /DNA_END=1097 /DNA_ORIENTATION=-